MRYSSLQRVSEKSIAVTFYEFHLFYAAGNREHAVVCGYRDCSGQRFVMAPDKHHRSGSSSVAVWPNYKAVVI
jgi:hypothetical protein